MIPIGPTDLTPEQRALRVAVAQDAMSQARADKIQVKKGVYFEAPLSVAPSSLDGLDLRDAVPQTQYCDVCALGACLVALANVADEMPAKNFLLPNYRHGPDLLGASRDTVVEQLDRVFDTDTQDVLEALFEGYSFRPLQMRHRYVVSRLNDPAAAMRALDKFQDTYPTYDARGVGGVGDPVPRFFALMQNIVDNDGVLELESLAAATRAVPA